MEFPAGAVTNLRMTELYSTVHWRIYFIDHQIHPPGVEVLDGLGSALTSELDSSILALRDHGCLVDTAPGEEGIWVFSHDGEFSNLLPFSTVENDRSLSILHVGTTTIRLTYADITPLGYLIKRLMTDPQSTIFSPLTQKNLAAAKVNYSVSWEAVTASAFYCAFTSAIAGLLSLRATQMHGAIPLGKRTLFTMVNSDEEPIHNSLSNFPLGYTALLSTLNIELSFKTLIISWRTIPQRGLQRLLSETDSGITSNLSLLEDIWLAPTGSLCRYIGPEPIQPDSSQWQSSGGDNNDLDFIGGGSPVHRREWKRAAHQWLQKFGLCLEALETEEWVEVETLNGTRNPTVVTKFFWPARLCFRRFGGCSQSATPGVEHFDPATLNPLEFAEKWFKEYETARSPGHSRVVSVPKEAEGLQPDTLAATERTSQSEACLSLARNINFPELSASAVYPTPPGGVTGTAFASVPATDGLNIPIGPGMSQPRVQSEIGFTDTNFSISAHHPAPTSLTGIDITIPALGIGSGMYDTTADDDLFDELDGNLETKQVTEADFNFFDQPDSANFPEMMGNSQQNADGFETPHKFTEEGEKDGSHSAMAVGSSTGSALRQEACHAPNNDQPHTILHTSDPEEIFKLQISSDASKSSFPESISPPAPLSPLKIKDLLFTDDIGASGMTTGISPEDQPVKRRNKSDYKPVSFKRNLSLSDKKYQMDGPFWFLPDAQDLKPSDKTGAYASDIPTIGIPKSPAKEQRRLDAGSGLDHSIGSSPESSTESSEDGDESDTAPPDRLNPGLRAVLAARDNCQFFKEFSLSPLERSTTVNTEVSIAGVNLNMLAFLRSLLFRGIEWSLDGYFPVAGINSPVLSKKEELIQVAQLAVDQVTQSSLRHNFNNLSASQSDYPNALPLSSLHNDSWHGEFASFDLRRYTSIDDDNSTPSLRKDFRYVLVGSISKLDPPHIQIHRGKGYLKILPPAILFWKPFGLEPTHGQKDIISFCIHPQSIQESADAFLDRLGLLYSSANLGRHSRPSGLTGLVPWNFDPRSGRDYATIMNGLQSTCEQLGDIISALPPGGETMVVYIANPFRDESAIIDICTAFLCLFRKYVSNVDKHAALPNEVALQIIPLDFIASITSLAVPSQREYLNLAFEVYSRCPPKQNSSELLGCAPPFTLAKSIPKFVPFKLASEPGSPLAERNFLHVAYSQSLDRRWITAAWTDNIGREQATLTYCLRERGSNVSRPFSEIRADIWDATLQIVGKSHSYWRVLLVKDEPVELDEAEAWVSLAQQHNQTKLTKIELTLLSVNTTPCLYFKLPSSPLQLTSLTGPSTSTPVSTPNPGMPSPDPSATAPTPPPSSAEQAQTPGAQFIDSTDSETVLVDKSDETWAVTLSHRLNISPSLTSYHPALASGYLVRRRGGTSDTDGLASLGVNLLFTHARIPTEMLLKDILRMYRDLTTLARTRGMIHAQGDAPLPWHISTAVKGREFLCCVL